LGTSERFSDINSAFKTSSGARYPPVFAPCDANCIRPFAAPGAYIFLRERMEGFLQKDIEISNAGFGIQPYLDTVQAMLYPEHVKAENWQKLGHDSGLRRIDRKGPCAGC
jgi:hypothetical protein